MTSCLRARLAIAMAPSAFQGIMILSQISKIPIVTFADSSGSQEMSYLYPESFYSVVCE